MRVRGRMMRVFGVCGLVAAASPGCDDDVSKTDLAAAPDLSVAQVADLATPRDLAQPPSDGAANGDAAQGGGDAAAPADAGPPDLLPPADLAVIPDMTKLWNPIILVEEAATVVQVPMGDAGLQPVPVRVLATSVYDQDPALIMHDYDDRNVLGLGCFADHFNLQNGKKPVPDTDLGTITVSGYSQPLTSLQGTAIPSQIQCALGGTGFYACGYGPLTNGMPGPDNTLVPVPDATEFVKVGTNVRVQFAGAGPLGSFDSANALVATAPIVPTTSLTTQQYSTTADTVLAFTCPDGAQGKCPAEAVLVQVMISSVAFGGQGYPGSEFGQIFCAGFAATGSLTIPKAAVTAAVGGSHNLVEAGSRVLRGKLPPSGLTDTKGNKVTIALGRGAAGFSTIK